MAKFKKGDKVTDGNAVYEITDVDDGVYKWKLIGGKGDPSYSEGGEVEWAKRKMRLANARACNAGKAMISCRGNDWYYAWADGAKEGREGPFKTEEEAIIAAKQDGFKIINSRACNSTNPIVANAMNACGAARNAMGLEEAEQRANQFVSAAKSRIASEAGTLGDTIKLLKQVRGHEDSKKIQDALMTLQWALQEINKAAQYFK